MAISDLQPAFLLHSRPYRNTSLLANFFTFEHGRVDAVVRGARSQKSKIRGLLQPFTPLYINWYGHGNLVTIKSVEPNGYIKKLFGHALLYGIYCNELLMRLLRGHGEYIDLYHAYEKLIVSLSSEKANEANLRLFEKKLLTDLGYALHLNYELESGQLIDVDAWYHYFADRGPVKLSDVSLNKEKAFKGSSLLAIENDDYQNKQVLRDAKCLMRYALRELLGDKPLKSRELFGA